jgi:holliday junction DNA helicase RuvA
MIGSLRGRLLDRSCSGDAVCDVLIEVAGVGYRVVTAPTTAMSLGEVAGEVFVWVHHHVRDDAETLYGFTSRPERDTFEALLGAHGVGPALALAILAAHDPQSLARILHDDDVAALCLVPGVGRKTAARLLVELKARLDVPDMEIGVAASGGNGAAGTSGAKAPASSVHADVRAALAGLGYTAEEIRTAMAELADEGDAATLLRAALTALATGTPRPPARSGDLSREH